MTVSAETIASGTVGILTWTLTADGTLTVSGEGYMLPKEDLEEAYGWKEYSEQITAVVLEPEVTNISEHAFSGCANLKSIIVPNGVVYIGERAFFGCTGLTGIHIPDGVTSIGRGAFYSCGDLTICGARDSYAETFAMKNGLSFKADATAPSNGGIPTCEIVLLIVAAIAAAAVAVVVVGKKKARTREKTGIG